MVGNVNLNSEPIEMFNSVIYEHTLGPPEFNDHASILWFGFLSGHKQTDVTIDNSPQYVDPKTKKGMDGFKYLFSVPMICYMHITI